MPYEPLNLVSSSDWAKVKYANTIKDNFDAIVGGETLLESINSLYGRLNTVANDLNLLEKELKNFTNTSQIDFTNKINELQDTYNTFKADVDNKLSESDDKLISLENDTGRKENLNEYFNDPNTGEKRNLPLSINKLLEDIGYVNQLLTVSKNVVGAINEHDTEIGNISDLTTNDKSSVVKALNELDKDIGDITVVDGQIKKDSIVDIFNEVNKLVGVLDRLTTTAKSSTVEAINELNKDVVKEATLNGDEVLKENNLLKITLPKATDNLLGAVTIGGGINVVDGQISVSKDSIGLNNVDNTSDKDKPISTLTQTAIDKKQDKLLFNGGIVLSKDNQVSIDQSKLTELASLSDVGDVKTLTTTEKTIVGAINELSARIKVLETNS